MNEQMVTDFRFAGFFIIGVIIYFRSPLWHIKLGKLLKENKYAKFCVGVMFKLVSLILFMITISLCGLNFLLLFEVSMSNYIILVSGCTGLFSSYFFMLRWDALELEDYKRELIKLTNEIESEDKR